MSELVVDPQIRSWVFLPIVVITFLVGILRHYISRLILSHKKLSLYQTEESQVVIRARVLRENAKYLPKASFLMRKRAFNGEINGYLTRPRPASTQSMIMDPSMMGDMVKGNLTNVLPMIVIGGWINWMFSGFITTKVPFPLTLRFKSMLQRGVELVHLDASWVSSASWYFLNVFGLRSIYTLVLGENNAADQNKHIEEQLAGTMPSDGKAPLKAEWEGLEILEHRWALEGIENTMGRVRKC